MSRDSTVLRNLHDLNALGVSLEIDDFGTGYSSLSYLHSFPIDALKIDRSFITRMDAGRESQEIVRTIISLGHNLGLKVVAEGIETQEQKRILGQLGCQLGQGYSFSKPLNRIAAESFMQSFGSQNQTEIEFK